MYAVKACPCCNQQDFIVRSAMVAPFVSAYVLREPARQTRLLECKACEFRFFEERFTDEEAGRLYSGYRGPEYFRERHASEPWYSQKLNDSIGKDPTEQEYRKKRLSEFASGAVQAGSVGSVLDYGGDRGQFIPEGLGRERFVYEISNLDPVPGVSRIADTKQLEGRRFDFVMLSHVLEHVSNPEEIISQMRGLVRENGGLLYLELPYERYRFSRFTTSALYRGYLGFVSRLRPLLLLTDFVSTALRIKLNRVPPFGFVKLHEHINFFDRRSLQALLERLGFEVIKFEISSRQEKVGYDGALLCLARLR